MHFQLVLPSEEIAKSLDRKFNIVLCPRLPMYLDYAQDTLQVHGVDWRKLLSMHFQLVLPSEEIAYNRVCPLFQYALSID